jgi:hypothetical protein
MNTQTTKQASSPRRIWIFFASDAPVGIILKRGPTDWVQLVKWDVVTDQFEPGQWMKARVNGHWFDVSPDGNLIVYWARANSARELQTWTAVSKPPYFTALALWPWYGTYAGGGFFETSTRLWLVGGQGVKLHPDFEPCPLEVLTAWPDLSPRLRSIPIRRMLRRGWRCIQAADEPVWIGSCYPKHVRKALAHAQAIKQRWEIWEWQSSKGETIRMLSYFPPVAGLNDALFYQVLPHGEERLIDYPVLDWDHRGRMVRVDGGKVFVAEQQDGELVEQELVDLNAAEPEPQAPPQWARTWT